MKKLLYLSFLIVSVAEGYSTLRSRDSEWTELDHAAHNLRRTFLAYCSQPHDVAVAPVLQPLHAHYTVTPSILFNMAYYRIAAHFVLDLMDQYNNDIRRFFDEETLSLLSVPPYSACDEELGEYRSRAGTHTVTILSLWNDILVNSKELFNYTDAQEAATLRLFIAQMTHLLAQ